MTCMSVESMHFLSMQLDELFRKHCVTSCVTYYLCMQAGIRNVSVRKP